MPSNPISRRDVLRTLAMGAVGGSVLQIIPLQAAEQIHHMVKKEKAQAPAGKYRPKFFSAHQYATLSALWTPSSPQTINREERCRRERRSSSICLRAKTKTTNLV